MKKRALLATALSLSLALQAPVLTEAAAAAPEQELTLQQAAAVKKKNGLKKENGKYYYYVNNRKLKSKWKTLKIGGKYYKYYFGKDGAACMGRKNRTETVYRVTKIGGAYYGFDASAHMIKGTYVVSGKLYVFSSSTGKLNTAVTNKLRAACKYGRSSAPLLKLLSNIGQKPLRRETFEGCFGDGKDVIYTFKSFQISGYEDTNGAETVFAVLSR